MHRHGLKCTFTIWFIHDIIFSYTGSHIHANTMCLCFPCDSEGHQLTYIDPCVLNGTTASRCPSPSRGMKMGQRSGLNRQNRRAHSVFHAMHGEEQQGWLLVLCVQLFWGCLWPHIRRLRPFPSDIYHVCILHDVQPMLETHIRARSMYDNIKTNTIIEKGSFWIWALT